MNKLFLSFFFFSLPSFAGTFNVAWDCPQDEHSGVEVIEQKMTVTISEKDGVIKLEGKPFDVKPKKGIAVNYAGCVENFLKAARTKMPGAKDWTQDIRSEISKQRYFALSSAFKLVPTKWDFNRTFNNTQEMGIAMSQWTDELENLCKGAPIQGKVRFEMLLAAREHSKKADSFPGLNCLSSLEELVNKKFDQEEGEYCGISSGICKELKGLRKKGLGLMTESRDNRKNANEKFEADILAHDSSEREKDFKKAFIQRFSRSPQSCAKALAPLVGDSGKEISPLSLHHALSDNMEAVLGGMDQDCQKDFARKYMEASPMNGFSESKDLSKYCANNGQEFCQSIRGKFKTYDKNLSQLISTGFGDEGKDLYQGLYCRADTDLNKFEKFSKQFTAFSQNYDLCRPLKSGDTKIVDTDVSPTGIPAKYSIEKTGDNKFKIRMNINFSQGSGNKIVPGAMEKRIQDCLEEVNPYFKGPGGQSLELEVLTPAEALKLGEEKRPPPIDISVTGFTPLSHVDGSGVTHVDSIAIHVHSRDFTTDISCPTIVHELLHWTGLADEYKTPGYPCRVSSTEVSIMRSHEVGLAQAVPLAKECQCETQDCKLLSLGSKKIQDLYLTDPGMTKELSTQFCQYSKKSPMSLEDYDRSGNSLQLLSESERSVSYVKSYWSKSAPKQAQFLEIRCQCPEKNEECLDFLENTKSTVKSNQSTFSIDCPEGAKTLAFRNNPDALKDRSKGVFHSPDGTFIFTSGFTIPGASILHPNQFNRVIEGACPTKAVEYANCARFAYYAGATCEKVPKECQDMKYFHGSKNAGKQ